MRRHILGASRAAIRVFIAAAFLLVAPFVVRAQEAGFDAWREDFGARLEQSIVKLRSETGSDRKSPIIVASKVTSETVGQPAQGSLLTGDAPQNRLPILAGILRENGLPPSLMSVAAVESAFNPLALSPKGARGLWQLMPATARRYGLRVEPQLDERTDPVKSTHAAAAYMKDLFAQFRDWPLALAAYNAGEDRVARAMQRTGGRDFWTLRRNSALPMETLRYVPAVLAKLETPEVFPLPAAVPPLNGISTHRGTVLYATPGPLSKDESLPFPQP